MRKLFTLFTVLLLSGCSIGDIFSKDPELFIDAIDLGVAYEDDETTANSDYNEKYIQITGIINYISVKDDEVMLQILGGVVCLVTSDIDSVDGLKLYNKVILNGEVEGLDSVGSAVIINECELIEVLTDTEVVTTSVELSSLNLDEMEYELIEISGVAEYIDVFAYNGWTLQTEDINKSLIVVFDNDFDSSEIKTGDTITVIGAFIPYIDYRTNTFYRIYGYEVSNILSGD